MSEHIVDIEWKNQAASFDYKVYTREYTCKYDNGLVVQSSAAPKYLGKPECVDPEESLVAALAGCHMLTFLAFCSLKKYEVIHYVDHAVGHLTANDKKKFWVSKIELNPKVVFAEGKGPTQEELHQLHDKAHGDCFIANSIKSEVVVNF